jgi:uncharacterized protein (DUF3084 family)
VGLSRAHSEQNYSVMKENLVSRFADLSTSMQKLSATSAEVRASAEQVCAESREIIARAEHHRDSWDKMNSRQATAVTPAD